MELGSILKLPSHPQWRNEIEGLFRYQPFALPNGAITGVGDGHLHGGSLRLARSGDDGIERFLASNRRLAAFYERLIAATVDALGGSVAGMTYCDFACNAGYFVYRFAQLGAARSVGVDVQPMSPAFAYANAALGIETEYVVAPYNWQTHEFEGFDGDFDIVSNIAFMCHSSDPQFLLAHLAKRARKALLIYSKIPPSAPDEYYVRFSPTTRRYFGKQFPVCFDAATEISEGMVTYGLKDLGFSRVTKIEIGSDEWTLSPKVWQAFVAVRD